MADGCAARVEGATVTATNNRQDSMRNQARALLHRVQAAMKFAVTQANVAEIDAGVTTVTNRKPAGVARLKT